MNITETMKAEGCYCAACDALGQEVDRLQRLLDERPAMNAELMDTYAAWTAKVYQSDLVARCGLITADAADTATAH